MLTSSNCSAGLHSCFSSDVIFTDSDLCGQDFAQWHVESHIAHLDMVPFLFKGLVPLFLHLTLTGGCFPRRPEFLFNLFMEV